MFRVDVACTPGPYGEAEPVEIDFGRRRARVREIVDRWLGEGYRYFKLLAEDGRLYVLRHDEEAGEWEVTIYERPPRAAGAAIGTA